jgi:hypothetical protein
VRAVWLVMVLAWLAGCQSPAGVAGQVRPGMTRAEVLQSMYEVTRRDGCPRAFAVAEGDFAYADLFWFGEPGTATADVLVVAYDWAADGRQWVVATVKATNGADLSDEQSRCAGAE